MDKVQQGHAGLVRAEVNNFEQVFTGKLVYYCYIFTLFIFIVLFRSWDLLALQSLNLVSKFSNVLFMHNIFQKLFNSTPTLYNFIKLYRTLYRTCTSRELSANSSAVCYGLNVFWPNPCCAMFTKYLLNWNLNMSFNVHAIIFAGHRWKCWNYKLPCQRRLVIMPCLNCYGSVYHLFIRWIAARLVKWVNAATATATVGQKCI